MSLWRNCAARSVLQSRLGCDRSGWRLQQGRLWCRRRSSFHPSGDPQCRSHHQQHPGPAAQGKHQDWPRHQRSGRPSSGSPTGLRRSGSRLQARPCLPQQTRLLNLTISCLKNGIFIYWSSFVRLLFLLRNTNESIIRSIRLSPFIAKKIVNGNFCQTSVLTGCEAAN